MRLVPSPAAQEAPPMTLADPTLSAPSPTRLFEKYSPVTGASMGQFPIADSEAVEGAVARARAAFPGWRDTPLAVRLEAINRGRDVLLEQAETYARKIADDTGKPIIEALMFELAVVPMFLDHYLKRAPKLLTRRKVSTPMALLGKTGYIEHFPRGVIGIIAPWNFPFQLSVLPVISALIGGNTAVLKPSEVTPIAGEVVADFFRRMGLPPGVVEVVAGDGSTGAALCRANVDMLFFTGSVATGRRVAAAAAERPIPCELELGGKDVFIVCADANLERAAEAVVFGSMANCGQACVSVERALVVDSVHDRFVELVKRKLARIKVGGPDEQAEMGPMTFAKQLQTVERHVEAARQAGAKVLTGGQRLDRAGLFYPPTLLTDVRPDMDIYREETFGPVLPVIRVRDEEEAVRLANASEFGLVGSVWTQDLDKGMRIASRLESGQVMINDVFSSVGHPGLPFGGVRSSGLGRYHGDEGLLTFMNPRAILVDRGKADYDPIWYPYTDKLASAFEVFRGVAGKKLGSLVRGFLGLRKASIDGHK
ncbi:aldehyde dehydrogenase family protein [Nannocystis sp.]|uniref:aldehyde dehydrogenase family protein n=1 Tax=Nannocystis sp. TaxID=1962667 RepID=UPI0025EB2CCD|nr:aldehyde dehydrogenase family protein [Nannocystis sp.]MBK7826401.1 aldehyde dehydrogenase family protein [Nannocystis sp.]